MSKPSDHTEHIVICECCEEWVCVLCNMHYGECPCPGIHEVEEVDASTTDRSQSGRASGS